LRDPALIEELGVGYARGGNLRPHLIFEAGLIGQQGQDAFCRRVIFPCRQYHRIVNLYGRSVGSAFPHRLLPSSKGGLFSWESVRDFATVILVEGFLDLAILWQAGFRNTTCAVATQLTSAQLAQLSDRPGRFVYIVFDQDENQAGQKAYHQCRARAESTRTSTLRHSFWVSYPYRVQSYPEWVRQHWPRVRVCSAAPVVPC
jgi:DNA primase